MRIADVSIADYDEDDALAYFASGSGKIIYSASDLSLRRARAGTAAASATYALPVRAPSVSDLSLSFSHSCRARSLALARARATARATARAKARAKAVVELLGVGARWQAVGAAPSLPMSVEDGAIWGTDGAFIASVADEMYEHTALRKRTMSRRTLLCSPSPLAPTPRL